MQLEIFWVTLHTALVAPFPFRGYLSPPVFTAAFNAVVELSLLDRSGTVIFLDFSVFYITGSDSIL